MTRPSRRSMDWVMATLAVAMLPQIAHMPWHVSLAGIAPIAWRIAAERRGWKPPPLPVRLFLAIGGVVLLILTYGDLIGRRAAVGLLTVMLALKLVEAWRLRDARLIVTIALFLCSTQFLFAQGIGMLVYAIAVLGCGLVALIHLQRDEAFAPDPAPSRWSDSAFGELRYSARLLAIALPLALALFFLFPRLGAPLWGIPDHALDARSGLSDSMAPGSIQSLYMDDSPAFRADFEGAAPEPAQRYWRGPVLWDFDGRTWTRGFYGRVPARASEPPGETRWRYRVQLEPTEQRWLFALDYPVLAPPDSVLTIDRQVLRRKPITTLLEYDMASSAALPERELSPVLRQRALALPEGFNPRTRALVNDWRAEGLDGGEIVRRALSDFRQQPFSYTLNPPLLGRDSVDEFLFDTRAGFCEHYASAFTVMMRMAGIPARVVTGYQGGFYTGIGDYVLVRQSDAHAWAEVWLEDIGWVRIDPTAAVSPERVSDGALDGLQLRRHWLDYAWARDIRNVFDLAQRGWNDWVITFSATRQSRLFSPLGLAQLGSAGLVAALIVSGLLLTAVALPLLRRLDAGRRPPPALRQWRRFRRRLARGGLAVHPGDGPWELAGRAVERWPEQADIIRQATADFVRCHYRSDAAEHLPIRLRRAVSRFTP